MNSPKRVGNIIKDYRLRKQLTQKQLANLLFVEESTVSRWECGLGYPNTALFDKICLVLNIPFDSLLNTKEEVNYSKNKRISFVIQIVVSIFSIVLLMLEFFKKEFLFTDVFRSIFAIITIVLSAFSLAVLGFIFFTKKYKIRILFCSLTYSVLLSLTILSYKSEVIFLSYLSLFVASIDSCLAVLLLIINLPRLTTKKRRNAERWLLLLPILISGFLLFYSLEVLSLIVFPPFLYFVFYLFGVVFNGIVFLPFYRLFHKKIFLIFTIAIAALINIVFFISLFIEQTGCLTDVLVYIGIAHFPLMIAIFTN